MILAQLVGCNDEYCNCTHGEIYSTNENGRFEKQLFETRIWTDIRDEGDYKEMCLELLEKAKELKVDNLQAISDEINTYLNKETL